MILNLNDSARDLVTDVCIIGAGAAGITIARQLAGNAVDVIVCEAGGLDYSDQSQSNYKGDVVGDAYFDLEIARLRYFGGTTNHWGGWCRPLDPSDLKPKKTNPLRGWPITDTDLGPYRKQTHEILEIAPEPDGNALGASGLKRISFSFSPPVRFGEKYRDELDRSQTARVLLHANLVGASAQSGRVTSIRVRDYDGNERTIRARYFIMACGGIENSRMLLWLHQTGQLPEGSEGRLIGRYWMEHPQSPAGDVVITNRNAFRFNNMALDFFATTPEFMESRNTLNCQLYLKTTDYGGAKEVVADLLCTAPRLGKWVMQQMNKDLACVARLTAAWEQAPEYSNHVGLSGARDAFGVPRPVLHWKRNAQDLHTVQETAIAFAKYCADANVGRVKLPEWISRKDSAFPQIADIAGYHHMGGTRMAASPDTGVVDADCRMYGTDNLYIAGSSVFPSSGHTPPTYTIVQLSLRLADHLHTLVASRA